MSTAIAGKKLSTRPAEPDDRQRARQSKRHPDCRSTTIKLTAHANIACVIVGPRQSSSRRDRRNGHPDCRCVPIQIVALHVIDGLSGSVHGSGTPRNQMHDWFAVGIEPITWKRKSRPIAGLQIEDPFEKASGAFKMRGA